MQTEEPFQAQVARLRRSQILNAAIKIFAERGFHRTTIRDIAKAAGVADGTIYNYFENKTALLLALLDLLNETERRDADLSQAASMDVRTSFRHTVAHRWQVLSGENLNLFRVVLSEVLVNPELRGLYMERIVMPTFMLAEPYFEHMVAVGKLRPINVALTLRAIAATFLGLLLLRLMGDPVLEMHADTIPDLLADLLLDGILPSEGDSNGAI